LFFKVTFEGPQHLRISVEAIPNRNPSHQVCGFAFTLGGIDRLRERIAADLCLEHFIPEKPRNRPRRPLPASFPTPPTKVPLNLNFV
jgi:hypothetical protein